MPVVRQYGQPRPPTAAQVSAYAAQHGLHLSKEETEQFVATIASNLELYEKIEALPEPPVSLKHRWRDPGHVPADGEDPLNAFVRFCEVRGAADGPLVGKTVGVKDCIAVAGVPLTDGGRRMPYLVPTEDAVVVERLLDAGATITGKTNMEDLAAGLGEGSYFGAALNPHNPRYSTGGSSSGSGAAVAAGMVDIALGADEAGSVRIPSAWCGIVGMKATHGLVPSYGMSYMDHTLDHIGPMTKTVSENAAVLEVLAGPDWRDPQWVRNPPQAGEYVARAGMGVDGLRIGVVRESLGPSGVTPEVATNFEAAMAVFEKLGAEVVDVDVPLWPLATPILMGSIALSQYGMWMTNGQAFGHLGRVDANTVAVNAAHSQLGADDLPPMLKNMLLTVEHLRAAYLGVHFAKAQNLRIEMRRQVSALFDHVDLLITPTTPNLPFQLLERKGTTEERLARAGLAAVLNTCPLDLTGHPAVTVPNGTGPEGLPTGLQVIGPHFGEAIVYQAAFAFEGA